MFRFLKILILLSFTFTYTYYSKCSCTYDLETCRSICSGNCYGCSGGATCPGGGCGSGGKGSPIYLEQGSFTFERTDIDLKIKDYDFKFHREYNHRSVRDSSLGMGWTHNHEIYLIDTSTEINSFKFIIGSSKYSFQRPVGTKKFRSGSGSELRLDFEGTMPFVCHNNGTRYIFTQSTLNKRLFLLKQVLTFDNSFTYTYDTDERLATVSERNRGRFIDFSYLTSNKLATVEDSFGRNIQFFYNQNNSLTSVLDPLGFIETYSYNDPFNPYLCTEFINKNGNSELGVTYDSNGNAISFTEFGVSVPISLTKDSLVESFPSGRVEKVSYGPTTTLTSRFIGEDLVETQVFDENRRLIYKSDNNLSHVAYAYDGFGNQIRKTHLYEAPLFFRVDQEFIDNSTESLTWVTSVLKSITLTREITGSNSIETYYITTLVDELVTEEVPIIRSNDFRAGKCSERGLIDALDKQTLQSLRGIKAGRDFVFPISKPYFKATTSADPDGCIYLDPSRLPGLTWTYDFVPVGDGFLVSKETIPEGYSKYYTYDSSGNILYTTSFTGVMLSYEYNEFNQAVKTYDGNGLLIIENIYDPVTLDLLQSTDAAGNSVYFTYDDRSNLIYELDYRGNQTSYEYDLLDRLIRVTFAKDEQDKVRVENYVYDGEGNQIEFYDGENNLTAMSYNDSNMLIRTEYADGTTFRNEYDEDRLTKTINERGATTQYIYDIRERLVSVIDSHGNSMAMSYDNGDNLVSEKDFNGNITTYSYDFLERMVRISAPEGNVTSMAYDSSGNLTLNIDADGVVTSKYYLGNSLLTTSAQVGATYSLLTTYTYNNLGLRLTKTTPKGHQTSYSYDNKYRLSKQTHPDGSFIQKLYDKDGNEIVFVNEKQVSWETSFDALNQLVSRADGLNQILRYEYDQAGNLTRQIWPKGNRKDIEYDSRNRQNLIRYYSSLGSLEDTVSKQYDSVGNVIAVSSASQSVIRSFDLLNRLTLVHIPALDRKVHYTYDPQGNRQTMVIENLQDNSINVTQYEYDKNNRLVGLIANNSHTSFKYTLAGRLTQVDYPNGYLRSQAYDDFGRLSNITYSLRGTTVSTFGYVYDLNGNKIEEHSNEGVTFFNYDERDRLLSANYPDGQTETFEYDPASNRVTRTINGLPQSYVFDQNNQLITGDSFAYVYDVNSSMTSRTHIASSTSTTFVYDSRLKLTSVSESNGTSSSFEYYPESDLRFKVKDTTGKVTLYLYDSENELQTVSEGGTSVVTIVNIPNMHDERLFSFIDNDTVTYIRDDMNSIRGLDSSTADLATDQIFNYFAYGDLRFGDEIQDFNYGYSGRIKEATSGLYNFRGRYYDTCTGTFTQVDPTRDGSNWFAYTGGYANPQSYNDPNGYKVKTIQKVVNGIRYSWRLFWDGCKTIGRWVRNNRIKKPKKKPKKKKKKKDPEKEKREREFQDEHDKEMKRIDKEYIDDPAGKAKEKERVIRELQEKHGFRNKNVTDL